VKLPKNKCSTAVPKHSNFKCLRNLKKWILPISEPIILRTFYLCFCVCFAYNNNIIHSWGLSPSHWTIFQGNGFYKVSSLYVNWTPQIGRKPRTAVEPSLRHHQEPVERQSVHQLNKPQVRVQTDFFLNTMLGAPTNVNPKVSGLATWSENCKR